MSTSDRHVTYSKKRWTTDEQAEFLTSKIPDFLRAQSDGYLSLFWPPLDKEWFARFPKRGLPAASPEQSTPDQPSSPLSAVAVLDLQRAITNRKNVCFFIYFCGTSDLVPSNCERGFTGIPRHTPTEGQAKENTVTTASFVITRVGHAVCKRSKLPNALLQVEDQGCFRREPRL
jgi:hypothetical protein